MNKIPLRYSAGMIMLILSFVLPVPSARTSLSESPGFTRQLIIDTAQPADINGRIMNLSLQDLGPTDIVSVTYSSDKKFFNATEWLRGKVYDHFQNQRNLTYGMYIDSDFNEKTGPFGGADYLVYVNRDNKDLPWGRFVYELEAPTTHQNNDEKLIESNVNPKGLYENGHRFINLYLNLSEINYPEKFRVLFYANQLNGNNSWAGDYTNWITIPQSTLNIKIPDHIEATTGDIAITDLQISSLKGVPSLVTLSDETHTSGIQLSFSPSRTSIGSSGITTATLKAKVPSGLSPGYYLVPFSARSVGFPRSIIEEPLNSPQSNSSNDTIGISSRGENTTQLAVLAIQVSLPLPWYHFIFDPVGQGVLLIIGTAVIAVYAALTFHKRKEEKKSSKETIEPTESRELKNSKDNNSIKEEE